MSNPLNIPPFALSNFQMPSRTRPRGVDVTRAKILYTLRDRRRQHGCNVR